MERFGAVGRWLRGIRGGEGQKEEKGGASDPKIHGGTAVSGSISRRTVLQAAAAVAVVGPEKAGRAVTASILGDTPTPEHLVARVAARLVNMAKFELMMHRGREAGELDPDDLAGQSAGKDTAVALENFLSNPSVSIDAQSVVRINDALKGLRGMQEELLQPTLTLGNLLDEKALQEAYLLAGATEETQWGVERIRAIGKGLQEITGLEDTATLSQVAENLREQRIPFVRKVLNNLDHFPSAVEKDVMLQDLASGLGDSEEEGDLREEISRELRINEPAFRNEIRREAEEREKGITDEFNQKLESRVPIYCAVSNVSSNERQPGTLRSFLIKPTPVVRGAAHGLTKMHIEHFRQFLYNNLGRLDDFKPGNVVVRGDMGEPEDGMVIDTSDPLLIEELEKALKTGNKIQIPNRLQAIPFRREE